MYNFDVNNGADTNANVTYEPTLIFFITGAANKTRAAVERS